MEDDEEGGLSIGEALALRYHLGLDAIDEEAARALHDAFEQRYPIEAGPLAYDSRFHEWWEQEKDERVPEITAALAQLREYLSPAAFEVVKKPASLDWQDGALSAVLGALFRPEDTSEDEHETDGGLSEKESGLRRALAKEGITIDIDF